MKVINFKPASGLLQLHGMPDRNEKGWLITWGRLTRHPTYRLVAFLDCHTGVCTFVDLVEGDPTGQLHILLEKCATARDMPSWICVDRGSLSRDRSFREWCTRNRIHLRVGAPRHWSDSVLNTELKLSILLGAPTMPDASAIQAPC